MAIAWKDVIAKPEYQQLSAQEKAAAQEQYFSDVVAPQAGDKAQEARAAFFSAYPAASQQEETAKDLQAAGIVEQQQMPDLTADELSRLPDNPAAFAQTLRQPNAEWVQQQYDRKAAQDRGGLTTLGGSVGKGVMNIARGLGVADEATPREQQRYKAAEEAYPITTAIGETVGEAAPFAPLSVAAAPLSLGARIAASGALGAAEAGLGTLGRTGDAGQAGAAGVGGAVLGAGIEAALPSLGRLGSALFRRVTGKPAVGALFDSSGNPTAEMQEALQKAGVSMDDLTQEALADIMKLPAGSSPEQAARIAQFQSVGVPFTAGNITQQLPQQAMEAQLAEAVSDPVAQALRGKLTEQSEAFRGALEGVVPQGAVGERAGESVKGALSGRKAALQAEKSSLYKQAGEQAETVGDVPVIPDNITAALPDDAKMRRIGRLVPTQAAALDDLLIEFGVKAAPEGFGGSITPLSAGNFEEFRQAINLIERGDPSGTIKVISGPVKQALDDEIDAMIAATSGSLPPELLGTLQKARAVTREMKTEFSPDSTAGRLLSIKRGGANPIMESSVVTKHLLGRASPIEDMQRTLATLSKAGNEGKQAIADLQSSAIMDLLEAGFGATSNKIDGVQMLSPAAFQRGLKKIGDKKLNLLFSNNPEGLKKLKTLGAVAGSMQKQAGAIPKGSASVNAEYFKKIISMMSTVKFPGAGLLFEAMDVAAKNKGKREAVKAALEAKPEVAKAAVNINRAYPAMAQALGIAGIGQSVEE